VLKEIDNMESKKIVLALGGNALGNNAKEQLRLVKHTANTVVDLISQGHKVVIGHGNGPQVGMINLAMESTAMPFPECGAMSQGYIGYHLQQAVGQELKKRGIKKEVACLVTQVVVDPTDEAFKKPTKPIGSFMTKEEADLISAEKGYVFVEDAGRGYRRVVASPQPKRIVELDIVSKLVEEDVVVITVGGGGIPVIETEDGLQGTPAVIDKDKSCARLAADLNADMLLILTAVDRVCINFNKPDQKELAELTPAEAKQYISEGQFAAGSMLPKVEACMSFVEESDGREALITSLEKAGMAMTGDTGTRIK
jgi:carbamate kinase